MARNLTSGAFQQPWGPTSTGVQRAKSSAEAERQAAREHVRQMAVRQGNTLTVQLLDVCDIYGFAAVERELLVLSMLFTRD